MENEKSVDEFRNWLEQWDLSERTINIYCFMIDLFKKEVKEINQINCNKFIKKHNNFYTRAALIKYLEFIGKDIKLRRVSIRKKDKLGLPNLMRLYEIIQKIKKYNIETYYVYNILYETGARIHEVLLLKIKDIDFDNNKIKFITKGNKERTVVISDKLSKELKKYLIEKKGLLSGEKCFFTKTKGFHNSYVRFRKVLYKLVRMRVLTDEEARLLKRTHNFRRAKINWLLDILDDNILLVKDWIGHEKLNTTQIYLDEKQKTKRIEEVNKKIKEIYNKGVKIGN